MHCLVRALAVAVMINREFGWSQECVDQTQRILASQEFASDFQQCAPGLSAGYKSGNKLAGDLSGKELGDRDFGPEDSRSLSALDQDLDERGQGVRAVS